MLKFIWKFIPAEWTWKIAARKATYMAGKAIAAILAYQKAQVLTKYFTPDQLAQVQVAAGAIVGAGLEAVHDALKLKFPEAKWF